jgi:transposase
VLKKMRLYRKRLERVAAEKYTAINLLRTLRFLIFRELLNIQDCVFVDETGIQDVDVRRRYGRALGLSRVTVAQQYVARTGRVSFVGALTVNGMLPCTLPFRGCMKGWLFEWWCLHMLLPCRRLGQTVIMDNAAFHRKNILRPLFALAGVNLLFLPAYSPEYNPIEIAWGYMKAVLNRLVKHNLLLSSAIAKNLKCNQSN